MKFFDPYAEIRVTENRLPHWQQERATYFVTFRLADSIPKQLLEQWDEEREAWLKWHPLPWSDEVEREYYLRFSKRIDEWLDAGHGACVPRRMECAQQVAAALRHFNGTRVEMIAFVIMPNRVHTLFAPLGEWTLERLVHSWKRHSAVRINRVATRGKVLWQRSYFDRLVRNQEHFRNVVGYIRNNPEKAHLRPGDYILYESDIARAVGRAV